MARAMNVPLLLGAHLVAIFLLLSCASSRPVDQITVRLPEGYAGLIHVDTCRSKAPAAEITVDDRGFGQTSICPRAGRGVQLIVERGNQREVLFSDKVVLSRSGDGFVTSVEAQISR